MKRHKDLYSKLMSRVPPKILDFRRYLRPWRRVRSVKSEDYAAAFVQAITPVLMAQRLCRTKAFIEEMMSQPEYIRSSIPKKSGGTREILAPEKSLRRLQQNINIYLQHYYSLLRPTCVHGFSCSPNHLDDHRDIVTNATIHVGKQAVLNIDLKDFFPGISALQVYRLFRGEHFRFDHQMASALTLLTTYQKSLPAGAPTSPVISNFICLEMDHELTQFCEENDLTFSRYADDLTFSSEYDISENLLLDILGIIMKHGFRVNEKKVRKQMSTERQVVTGLVVNERLNVERKKLKKIRAMLHVCRMNGVPAAAMRHLGNETIPDYRKVLKFAYQLHGMISHVGHVRGRYDPQYLKFLIEFEAADLHRWLRRTDEMKDEVDEWISRL